MYFTRRLRLKMLMMSNSQPQSSKVLVKWTEIIEDFWKAFKNKDQLYDENCLKYNCLKLQFHSDEVEESDNESWLNPLSSDTEEEDDEMSPETQGVSQFNIFRVLYD